MKTMTINRERAINGGKTYYYSCPWKDYTSTSYWKTYAHAIKHAYKKGYFALPFALIRTGLGL